MHGSIWGKYIKDVTKYDLNMQADTVKTAIKKLTETLEKTQASFPMSEFKSKIAQYKRSG